MIISSVSLAQDVTVNRDSVGAHGAVNQVVVVNPSPAPKVVRRMPPPVINNYYPSEPCSHSCEPNTQPVPQFSVESSSRFDYQDIWLFILTLLFAIGLGIFIGYLIWRRNHSWSYNVTVHSHGGRSGSYSRSSSSSHRSSSSGPVPPAPAAPIDPAQPASAPAQAEEKK